MFAIDLSGKTALVTGAAQGIGRGCALALATAGAHVILNDIDVSTLEQTATDIRTHLGSCTTIAADTFEEEARARSFHDLDVDILVSNPYRTIRKPLLDLSVGDWTDIWNATFLSHVRMANLVARRLVNGKRPGSIIFISSIYGTLNRVNSGPYDASKAALNHMMRVAAREWAPHRIRVNAIAPGYTDTPGEHQLAKEAEMAQVARQLPFGELCHPSDIGNMAAFLASDLARMITGQVMTIDGGHSLCDFSYVSQLLQGGQHA